MATVQSIADPLYELLVPYFDPSSVPKSLSPNNPLVSSYLNHHLTGLSLSSLTSEESQSLSQSKSSVLLSLQALSKQSHKSIISSCTHLSKLGTELSLITESTASALRESIPQLDEAAIRFSESYNTRSENAALERRRIALLLSRNVDRISTILELPALLNSAIQSSNQAAASTLNYASALDLNAHIRRLHSLFPESGIIQSVEKQSEEAMRAMTSNLILSLKSNSLKLAGAMRLISCLRRISPELDSGSNEGALGSLFLTCRLAYLQKMLEALEPLRELADQEKKNYLDKGTKNKWESGQQTERYLKRYIEIFREQSFAIISMYRSIFLPPSNPTETETRKELKNNEIENTTDSSLQPKSSVLATFSLNLVYIFSETLELYLPNVREKSSRDSLLTQVLYCAASLGRLGSDFTMILSILGQHHTSEKDGNDEEWAEIIKKHRMLAGRLELMVGSRET
ncbi:Conserved oligomeric Golgi complex subunit 8 [Erysiphe neolycopersici]|uniref:Conserved oligomeric Golgi complex subunit 8 n=1 Tax=Erysiphe neolycopersici TaxID=212602 RepID=A0A420HV91_9PEZI|nr:Conserved oligomeric Golgi complex subunit 8 [Erysiphe neolycopersici]